MKIYAMNFEDDYDKKFMESVLINHQEPFQIEFILANYKSEKIKKIADFSFCFKSSEIADDVMSFAVNIGLYSQHAFESIKGFLDLQNCILYKVWYEKSLFYLIYPPLIIPQEQADEYVDIEEVMRRFYIPNTHFFIPSQRYSTAYVTEEFRQNALKHKVTGMGFQLKWEGEL